jgi:hypothetical protein
MDGGSRDEMKACAHKGQLNPRNRKDSDAKKQNGTSTLNRAYFETQICEGKSPRSKTLKPRR